MVNAFVLVQLARVVWLYHRSAISAAEEATAKAKDEEWAAKFDARDQQNLEKVTALLAQNKQQAERINQLVRSGRIDQLVDALGIICSLAGVPAAEVAAFSYKVGQYFMSAGQYVASKMPTSRPLLESSGSGCGTFLFGVITSFPHAFLGFWSGAFTAGLWVTFWDMAIQAIGYHPHPDSPRIGPGIGALGGACVAYISGIIRTFYRTGYWRSLGVLFLGPVFPPLVAGVFAVFALCVRLVAHGVGQLGSFEVVGTVNQWGAVGAIIGLCLSPILILSCLFASATDSPPIDE